MSYTTVRNQIAAFLADPPIVGVQKVFRAPAYYTDGSTWNLGATLTSSGSIVYLHLASDEETRESLPAVEGLVDVDYNVMVIVAYQYLYASAADEVVSPDAWVDPMDATLQGIKDRIHSDPALGDPTIIKLAAQEPRTLRSRHDLPVRWPGSLVLFTTIEFQATEVVVA